MKRKLDDDLLSTPTTGKKAKLILKDHFLSPSHLKFLISEIENSPSIASVLPPLIFGHSQFGEIFFESKHGDETKLTILKLLKTCFSKDDEFARKNMHEAHVPLLLGAYTAKVTKCDRILYDLFRLYEKVGRIDLTKYYPLIWGEVGLQKYATLKSLGPALWNRPTPDDVLDCLDPRLMKWSGQVVPLEATVDSIPDHYMLDVYDPRFLLTLFVTLLSSETIIDNRRFAIEKSCLSYTICCLSLHDPILRGTAYTILYRFRDRLRATAQDKTNFREKPLVVYILNLLRQSITKPLARIPSISALFLARAVQLTATPWDSLYSTINSYLLLKPRLDFGDLPEFYKLFQSASTDDRFWILRLMADGIKETTDYRICERRDAFRLIISYYDWSVFNKESEDAMVRLQIMKIIAAVCRIGTVAPDFCYRYNLIGWLTGAVGFLKKDEEAVELATIFRLIFDNVVGKEVPEYVGALWYSGAILLKEKANGLTGGHLESKKGWSLFLKCLKQVEEKF